MKKILDLGDYYISNFVKPDHDYSDEKKYSLDLYLDEDIGAPRLKEMPPADKMYGQYWYRSGINNSMVAQLQEIAEEVSSRVPIQLGDIWLDIACNDGTMFKFIPEKFIKIGIDPADDTFLEEAQKKATEVVQDFFSTEAYRSTTWGSMQRAKVITSIAMFYDLDDPHKFIEDIKDVMDPDGVWVLQLSYTPLMLQQLAFDNICHEHIYYYSLTSLEILMSMHGLQIVDASLNDTNGGSIRVYVRNLFANNDKFSTQPSRDVCNYRVNSILSYERQKYDVTNMKTWDIFHSRIERLKEQTVGFIEDAVAKGKTVMGYGASTKGNTLLQHFGLDSQLISAIAERSSYKYGLKTIGTDIPIISEDAMRQLKPDYLLILPWHFISTFVEREKEFLNNGGQFIVPCPDFKIIGGDNA
jgi:hypothetical protein